MKTFLLGLLAETPIHPGAGRSLGAIDLPVAREAATDYPVLVGSALKGALRDHARGVWPADREEDADRHKVGEDERPNSDIVRLFGYRDSAGGVLVSDARLLLLPVRCLTGRYRWATCPAIIERLKRDLQRAGLPAAWKFPTVTDAQALASGAGDLFLEERQFTIAGAPPADLLTALKALIPHEETRKRVDDQVAILSDNDFTWFARYGLCVQARNVLDPTTKQSTNLWYEETLPPDTLMASIILLRDATQEKLWSQLWSRHMYLQAGGNETVGQGWFAIQTAQPMTEAP